LVKITVTTEDYWPKI